MPRFGSGTGATSRGTALTESGLTTPVGAAPGRHNVARQIIWGRAESAGMFGVARKGPQREGRESTILTSSLLGTFGQSSTLGSQSSMGSVSQPVVLGDFITSMLPYARNTL